MKTKRYKIQSRGNRPFIRANQRRYYFDQIDRESGIPCEYPAFFRVTGFEYGIDDYAIVEEINPA